jgi:hypothetical protein
MKYGVDCKGEPIPDDAKLKNPKPKKKFDWEKEKARRKRGTPRLPRGIGETDSENWRP